MDTDKKIASLIILAVLLAILTVASASTTIKPITNNMVSIETQQASIKPIEHIKPIWEDTMNLAMILEFEEGFSPVPYLCDEGYVTIGFGTKLHKYKGQNPKDFYLVVGRSMAMELLHTEVDVKERRLESSIVGGVFSYLSPDRRAIILSMAYQMGTTGTMKFHKMWVAIASGQWEEAAAEALDSRWARQTPERADRHARVLRGESLEAVYKLGY